MDGLLVLTARLSSEGMPTSDVFATALLPASSERMLPHINPAPSCCRQNKKTAQEVDHQPLSCAMSLPRAAVKLTLFPVVLVRYGQLLAPVGTA